MSIVNGGGSGAPTGGGIANVNGNPILKNVTFYNNVASNGGGMSNLNGNPLLENVTFNQNLASFHGGGLMNTNSHPVLKNVTFSRNAAEANVPNPTGNFGGGMSNDASDPTIINSIFWDDISGEIENTNGSAPDVTYGIVQGGYAGIGNLDSNPLLGKLGDNGGITQTMALNSESPAINAGDDLNCPNTDQRGVTRPQGSQCDIGAYEDQLLVTYVKQDATGANDGTSWTNAYTDLQSALSAASSDDEVWVAAGAYYPTSGTDRAKSFTLKSGVSVYGGFDGTETLRTQRDFEINIAVLSGDIGIPSDNSDNSYHVVVGSNTDNATLLDGFTITGGNASSNSSVSDQSKGGGMYNYIGSPTVSNVIFSDNYATFGGGMYTDEWDGPGPYPYIPVGPVLTNVVFRNNTAVEGGGMRNENYSNLILTNVIFDDNVATRSGGGMENFNYSSPVLTNVAFINNTAGDLGVGGGMFNWVGNNPSLINVTFSGNTANWGGGLGNYQSSPSMTNVTFSGNSAITYGGGISNESNSNPTLNNVTVNGNSAVTYGGGIYNDSYGSNVSVHNSILYDNSGGEVYNVIGTANVTYSIVQGGYSGTGNLDADPLLGPLQDNGGFTQTMTLDAGSPAIDAGDDANCPATDQRGVTRPQGSHCDIGAYEYEFVSEAQELLVLSTASQDGWIRESSETSNKGGTMNKGSKLFYVGDNKQDKQYKSFLSFNTAGLPDNAKITNMQLKIKIQGVCRWEYVQHRYTG